MRKLMLVDARKAHLNLRCEEDELVALRNVGRLRGSVESCFV